MAIAARKNDRHLCPKADPGTNQPHVGGTITGGVESVVIGSEPAAVVGSPCKCVSPEPNEVSSGSGSVLAAGRPLARQGDETKHGGAIATGCPSVHVG
jgi:uncharacterized Zn-binding protein involved in type VI secretion